MSSGNNSWVADNVDWRCSRVKTFDAGILAVVTAATYNPHCWGWMGRVLRISTRGIRSVATIAVVVPSTFQDRAWWLLTPLTLRRITHSPWY